MNIKETTSIYYTIGERKHERYILRKLVEYNRKANKELETPIVICDSASILYDFFNNIKYSKIIIPKIVYKQLNSIAADTYSSKYNTIEEDNDARFRAKTVLAYLDRNQEWFEIVDTRGLKLFEQPVKEIKAPNIAIVALACEYHRKGYINIIIRSGSADVEYLSKLQNEGFKIEKVEK